MQMNRGSEGEGCTAEQGKTKINLCNAFIFFCACMSHLWILAWKADCFVK